jgi:CHAD domain-containing protein
MRNEMLEQAHADYPAVLTDAAPRRELAGLEERSHYKLAAGVHQARPRVRDWPLERQELDSLAPGLRRIYRRGRRAYRSARDEPSTENLHELRKRVKDLWYAAQIVTPASPKPMKRLARRAHRLSDLIGEDHDLAMLAEHAIAHHDRFDDDTTVAGLVGLIERRRQKLQRKAMKLGQRLYRRKPRKVARVLEHAPQPAGG